MDTKGVNGVVFLHDANEITSSPGAESGGRQPGVKCRGSQPLSLLSQRIDAHERDLIGQMAGLEDEDDKNDDTFGDEGAFDYQR